MSEPLSLRDKPQKKAKRKANDDLPDEAPQAKRPEPLQLAATDNRASLTRANFSEYREAYEGKHTRGLGGDHPRPGKKYLDGFKKVVDCVAIFSDGHSCTLLPDLSTGSMRMKYDGFSQNPNLEVRLGRKREADEKEVWWTHTLNLNSEQMDAKIMRQTIKEADSASIKQAMRVLGVPSAGITDDQLQMVATTLRDKYRDNSVDFIRLKLRKSDAPTVRITRGDGFSVDREPPLVQQVRDVLDDTSYILLIRTATPEHHRFVDELWDYLIHRCMDDGIYWGYDLERNIKDIEGDEHPFAEAVLLGLVQAPFLPWMVQEGELLEHVRKKWFTSMKEWRCRFTVALLQDFERQRQLVSNYYSFDEKSLQHKITVEDDPANPRHFTLHVDASKKPGEQLPAISADTKFKIRHLPGAGETSNFVDLEATLVELPEGLEIEADFLLDVLFADEHVPWGEDFSSGEEYDVALEVVVNATAALRQLRAMHEASDNAPSHIKELYMGFASPSENCSSKQTYSEQLESIKTSDPVSYNTFLDWNILLQVNELQLKAIDHCVKTKARVGFVQGPPGTGKSVVAVTAALYVAQLGKSVLVASPTRTAGKANAIKLAKDIKTLPEATGEKLDVVYFPTWRESVERMLEARGSKPQRANMVGDDKFVELQLWSHIIKYARALLESPETKDDLRAQNFVATFDSLSSGVVLSPLQDKVFKKDFKALAFDFLDRKDYTTIVITTCNNSACLAKMKIPFSLIIVDEAAFGVEYDICVPLQIEHDSLLFLGDHLQLPPVVTSKGRSEYYLQVGLSQFERILEHTSQERTLLKISYRFGQTIATPVGMFGGYKGLASVATASDWYKQYAKAFGATSYSKKIRARPTGARRLKGQDHHRLLLNVHDSHSSNPRGGTSTVNFANVNAGIAYLKAIVTHGEDDIESKDCQVIVPFTAQASVWKAQLKIQWPKSNVSVVTIGTSQGNEARLALFDATIAHKSEGAFLGFLKMWNRPNVALSRGIDVVAVMLNERLMRNRLETLYNQSKPWALYLLDCVDNGIICDVEASSSLPINEAEYSSQKYSNDQPAGGEKGFPISKVSQPGTFYSTSVDSFTKLERKYLSELEVLRSECSANVSKIKASEAAWQAERVKARADRKANANAAQELPFAMEH